MPDQDEPVGPNPPTWNLLGSSIGSKPNTPFNIQEFGNRLAGVHTHDFGVGMADEKLSKDDPEVSYTAIQSEVTVPTAAAQEGNKTPTVDELQEKLMKDY